MALVKTAQDMLKIGAYFTALGGTTKKMPGWSTRHRRSNNLGDLRPDYVVPHHTAARVDVDNILLNGRPDVSGPLCNWALHADETLVFVAAGPANHAGVASVGSSRSLGIEATGPPFSNYRAYVKVVAAHRLCYGYGNDKVRAHKEICIPKGRKPDPAFDMDTFRDDVEATVRLYKSGAKTQRPVIEEDDLSYSKWSAAEKKALVDDVNEAISGSLHAQLYRALLVLQSGGPNSMFNQKDTPDLFGNGLSIEQLLKKLEAHTK